MPHFDTWGIAWLASSTAAWSAIATTTRPLRGDIVENSSWLTLLDKFASWDVYIDGKVQPGDTVAIVGAGPIGLSAILGAKLFSPGHVVAIDLADARLEVAKHFGADVTINSGVEAAVAIVQKLQ
jgi:NADPH:quinone reductase-like Zn-dependent oxidoreductase